MEENQDEKKVIDKTEVDKDTKKLRKRGSKTKV